MERSGVVALVSGGIVLALALGSCQYVHRSRDVALQDRVEPELDAGDEEEQDRVEAAVRAAEEAGEREARSLDAGLIKAAGTGDQDALRELLERGADPDADNEHDWTALHAAATKGHEECVAALVEAGATVDAEDGGCSTPLMAAARGGHVEVTRLLLKSGADIAKRDGMGNRGGRTALSRAKRAGKHDVVALLEGWVTQRPEVANLEEAAKAGDAHSMREMLDNGVEPNVTNLSLWTALHQAAQKGHADCVAELLARGATADPKDRVGRTPLILAAPISSDVVRLLLTAGADHSATTRVGDSALHWAASKGATASIKLLLSSGAAINAQNDDGRTPLMSCGLYGHADSAAALLDAGADPTICDKLGRTALDIAKSLGTAAMSPLERAEQG
eukprot:COSAG02_NODE_2356_length_9072_cov_14.450017_2_plen_391_part_00